MHRLIDMVIVQCHLNIGWEDSNQQSHDTPGGQRPRNGWKQQQGEPDLAGAADVDEGGVKLHGYIEGHQLVITQRMEEVIDPPRQVEQDH